MSIPFLLFRGFLLCFPLGITEKKQQYIELDIPSRTCFVLKGKVLQPTVTGANKRKAERQKSTE